VFDSVAQKFIGVIAALCAGENLKIRKMSAINNDFSSSSIARMKSFALSAPAALSVKPSQAAREAVCWTGNLAAGNRSKWNG
jgi:hypothetical protein